MESTEEDVPKQRQRCVAVALVVSKLPTVIKGHCYTHRGPRIINNIAQVSFQIANL